MRRFPTALIQSRSWRKQIKLYTEQGTFYNILEDVADTEQTVQK
jgi:hypothetical protein